MQTFQATVKKVKWHNIPQNNINYLIPQLEIHPIMILGNTIQFVSVVDARYIKDNVIGNGSIVNISMHGDIIPTVNFVTAPSANGTYEFPTCPYEWTEYNHIKEITYDINNELDKLFNAEKNLMDIIYHLCTNNLVNGIEEIDVEFKRDIWDEFETFINEFDLDNDVKVNLISHFRIVISKLNKSSDLHIQNIDQLVDTIEKHTLTFLRDIWFCQFQIQFNNAIYNSIISLCSTYNVLFSDGLKELIYFSCTSEFETKGNQTKLFSNPRKCIVNSFHIATSYETQNKMCYNWTPKEFISARESIHSMYYFEQIKWKIAQSMIENKTGLRQEIMNEFDFFCKRFDINHEQISYIKQVLSTFLSQLLFSNSHSKSYTFKNIMGNHDTHQLVNNFKSEIENFGYMDKLNKMVQYSLDIMNQNLQNDLKKINVHVNYNKSADIALNTQCRVKRSLDTSEAVTNDDIIKKHRVV